MSEPRKVSPMLDGFAVGAPMSSRSGVCCCPAIRENSDHRYIVKIISVPSSQTMVDALLLVKAYRDPSDALGYFKEQADEILAEAEFLQSLSQQGGFLAYEAWQAIPMQPPEIGYDVYLLGNYRRSLAKQMLRNPLTHLDAVNLGLDICAALATCRKAGKICTDLKPENIFVTQEKRYQIGDIGFAPLDSLCTASLPDRCRSPYAPPETGELLATLNDTVDTYAIGMILYRIFNGGKLPEADNSGNAELSAPAYADEDMSQIILKACAGKAEDRWNNPDAMGQAIANYLQCHTVNDTPIAPESTEQPPEESTPSPDSEPEEALQFTDAEPEEKPDQRTAETWEIVPEESTDQEPIITETVADTIENSSSDDMTDSPFSTSEEDNAPSQTGSEPSQAEEMPGAAHAEAADDFSDELAELHQLLQDVPDAKKAKTDCPDGTQQNYDSASISSSQGKNEKSGIRKFLITLLILLLLALISLGGYVYYRFVFIINIDSLQIGGSQNEITVSIMTTGDESQLSVTCIDVYGKEETIIPENGQAVFENLASGSLYKIQVETTGFHKLTGETSGVFTTSSVTEISGIIGITGSESGSVLLTMTVTGNEPASWLLAATADGEETVTQEFTGHSVSVKGLTVGKTYTFQISASDATQLTGSTSIEFTPCELILAQNLTVTAHSESSFTVQWDSGDAEISNWTVHCSGGNYDESLETSENEVTFEGTNSSNAYTVDVTAAGMSQSARIQVTANPINITGFDVTEDTESGTLHMSWEYSGSVPQSGWTLTYSIDGYSVQETIDAQTAYAEISPLIPSAKYGILISTPDEVSIFQNSREYTAEAAEVYTGHGISGYKITAKSLVTPPEQDWTQSSVSSDDYTTEFTVGQSISLVLQASVNFYLDDEDMTVMYVIRDKDGNAIPSLLGKETKNWHDLWAGDNYHYCELTLPNIPTSAGEYTIDVYFDGQSVVSVPVTIG